MSPFQNKGTNNFRNKLTEEEVKDIFLAADRTQSELASQYGVSQGTISHIRNRITWGWLTENLLRSKAS